MGIPVRVTSSGRLVVTILEIAVVDDLPGALDGFVGGPTTRRVRKKTENGNQCKFRKRGTTHVPRFLAVGPLAMVVTVCPFLLGIY